MMFLVNFVSTTVYTQLVLFAKERLGAGAGQLGLLYSAGSVGVVALSLAAGPLRRRLPFGVVALGFAAPSPLGHAERYLPDASGGRAAPPVDQSAPAQPIVGA